VDPQELLTKARQKIAEARKAGFSDQDIDAYLKAEIGIGLAEASDPGAMDYLRAALQGASAGFSDEIAGAGAALIPGGKGYTEARDEIRENLAGARAVAPKSMIASEIGGGAVSALAGGAALRAAGALPKMVGAGAKMLGAAKAGAISGGLAGVGYSDKEDLAGVAQDAGVGAGLGAGLGVAGTGAGALLGRAGRVLKDRLAPGAVVRREAALALPDDAAKIMRRQEQLAPGTALPADFSSGTMKLAKIVGADPATAMQAKAQTAARIPEIQQAIQRVASNYTPFDNVRVPVDAKVAKILVNNSIMPDAQGTVAFKDAQILRTAVRERLKEAKRAAVKQELKETKTALDKWLQQHIPGLKDIDAKFGFMSQRKDAAVKLAKTVDEAAGSYGSSRAAGVDPSTGSAGAQFPGTQGVIAQMFEPNRGDRGKIVRDVLMTPGAGIEDLLKRRQSLLTGPGRIQQALFDAGMPFVGTGAGAHGPSLFGQ
jgi:hypothetical protein